MKRKIKRDRRDAIYRRDDYRCYLCGKTVVVGFDATVDHYIPRSKGGTNDDLNLVTCCDPCNVDKRSSLPTDLSTFGIAKAVPIRRPNP